MSKKNTFPKRKWREITKPPPRCNSLPRVKRNTLFKKPSSKYMLNELEDENKDYNSMPNSFRMRKNSFKENKRSDSEDSVKDVMELSNEVLYCIRILFWIFIFGYYCCILSIVVVPVMIILLV